MPSTMPSQTGKPRRLEYPYYLMVGLPPMGISYTAAMEMQMAQMERNRANRARSKRTNDVKKSVL